MACIIPGYEATGLEDELTTLTLTPRTPLFPYPSRFQRWVKGWLPPSESKARTKIVYPPGSGGSH